DDSRIPEETRLYYSTHKLSFSVVASVLFLIASVVAVIKINDVYLRIFIVAFFAISFSMLYKSVRKMRNTMPVIIMNDKGIETKGEFLPWSDIANEQINDTKEITFLEYDHVWDNKTIETIIIEIETLKNVDPDYIQHIMKIY